MVAHTPAPVYPYGVTVWHDLFAPHFGFALKSMYYVCMGTLLQIRDVPDDARRALKIRAAARGESLNRYLLDVIEREVARPTLEEVLARAARRAEQASASAVGVIEEARGEREGRLSPGRW